MIQPMRIFIVGDDHDVAEGLADILEMEGHEVTLAHSGEDALEIFTKQDFDIAFMDVMMPGMNGVESFLKIRQIKPNARVVMMTGYSVEQLLAQAVENGALGVMTKPVDFDELHSILERVRDDKGVVLIADRDSDFVAGIQETLNSQGYSSCIASNGQEALSKVLNNSFDILTLDLVMPVIGGLEIYLELKKRERHLPTIIVVESGATSKSELGKLEDMQINGALFKPLEANTFLEILDQIKSRKAA